MERPYLCVDFDGVLNQYDGVYGGGAVHPPAAGVRQFLEALDVGYTVVILTARDVEDVWAWLDDHALMGYVDQVTNEKIPAFAYIDDRAICHRGDFGATLAQLEAFTAHWEPSPLPPMPSV